MSDHAYVVVHFSGDEVRGFRQERLVPVITDFYDHYAETLGSSYFNVRIHTHHQKVQCALHLVAESKTFLVRGQDTDARSAFEHALYILTSQVRTYRDAAVKDEILRFVHEPMPERFTIRV